MQKLLGRVAVVTGAASGIGEAIARTFAAEGASVGLVDINKESVTRVADDVVAAGARVRTAQCDVGDEAQVGQVFPDVSAELGPVDILVNCAAIDPVGLIAELPTTEWDEVIRVNLRSVFLCSRAVIPGMRDRRWGRIINVASQLGHKGARMKAHYSASKGGVISFTRALARELVSDGITVNAICPGPIDTPMLRATPRDWLQHKFRELPAGRAGRVDEIAPTALLLASDEGSYYVGATLNVNGGDVMI